MTTIDCNVGWKVVTFVERYRVFHSVIPRRSITVTIRSSHMIINTKALRTFVMYAMGGSG